MDLSTGGDIDAILTGIVNHSPVMIGTVPIYRSVSQLMVRKLSCGDLTEESIFGDIEAEAKMGVDFMTRPLRDHEEHPVDPGKLRAHHGHRLRGGSLMAEWMQIHGRENPLYEHYDRLLEIAREYDVTLSLGDGLRPGSILDAEDRAQVAELITLGELVEKARKAGVQVMVEGPGHVPLSRIAADMKQQKRICSGAPYYVLGPLPTDIAPGYDHIVGAIGGAIAAASGASFLCYVTPAEHLGLPTVQDVYEGVMASRIAAHIGDLEKGVPGVWERDRTMSEARRRFDWETMFKVAMDPAKARRVRCQTEDKDRDVCTMCGELCAMKTYERFGEGTEGTFDRPCLNRLLTRLICGLYVPGAMFRSIWWTGTCPVLFQTSPPPLTGEGQGGGENLRRRATSPTPESPPARGGGSTAHDEEAVKTLNPLPQGEGTAFSDPSRKGRGDF